MNIDSLNILSILSSDKNLEKIQQAIAEDSSVAGDFTDLIQDKIAQLKGLNSGNHLTEKFNIDFPDTEKLHEIAGQIDQNHYGKAFSSLFGKYLPTGTKLEKDINLENTLETLANVLHTLEGSQFDINEFDNRLSVLHEKIEKIKPDILLDNESAQKLNSIAAGIKKIHSDISNDKLDKNRFDPVEDPTQLAQEIRSEITDKDVVKNDHEINHESLYDITNLLQEPAEHAVTVVQEPLNFGHDENGANPAVLNEMEAGVNRSATAKSEDNGVLQISKSQSKSSDLTKHIDKLARIVKQIEESLATDKGVEADLDAQIDLLATEFELINEVFYLQSTTDSNAYGSDGLYQLTQGLNDQGIVKNQIEQEDNHKQGHESSSDDQNTETLVSLVDSLNQSTEFAGDRMVEQLAQQLKPEISTDTLALKQKLEDKPLSLPTKNHPESLLKAENSEQKPVIDNPVINTINSNKVNVVQENDFKFINEKGELKFVTDFSTQNRPIPVENKLEIPPMTRHFAHPEWKQEMGEKVLWMHKQAIPSAELRLNPKHLGPINIKVDVNQDQATVNFTAQHVAVKEAIDAAIPKLREMFSAQQLNLVDVNVSQENLDHRQSKGFAQMGNEQGKNDKQDQDAENENQNDQKKGSMEILDEIEAGRAIASNGVLSIFA